MTYKTSISDRLPEDLKEFAGTIETLMIEQPRTLNGLTASYFDRFVRECVAQGRGWLAELRAEFVEFGEMYPDY